MLSERLAMWNAQTVISYTQNNRTIYKEEQRIFANTNEQRTIFFLNYLCIAGKIEREREQNVI